MGRTTKRDGFGMRMSAPKENTAMIRSENVGKLIRTLLQIGVLGFVSAVLAGCADNPPPVAGTDLLPKERLGRLLFHDKNLSTPAGQSCADCHAAEAGFGNPNSSLPVSQGVIKDRFGNRNDLPAAYAGFSPPFHFDEAEQHYVGGQFWDGRASSLEEQAKGPFLNPLEMANPDEQAVVDSIRKSEYAGLFQEVFGAGALDDTAKAYDLAVQAIAAFERSHELNRFDSKYDLFLAGETSLTDQEKRGLQLFEDEKKGNCAACHPSKPGPYSDHALFTDFTYDNLGLPKNPENPFYYLPPSLNPEGLLFVDAGLGGIVKKPELIGLFKVPSLRNITLTAPYMHNGIFKNLRQVMVFYNSRDIGPWPAPEVAVNVNREELGDLGLSEEEMADIIAFLHTLTDGYAAVGKK
ncbi:MAG: cytochrome c peroxidase family protein [Acidobacteria bacterium]|nr:cytochrome c peroxidase family protein [Acidobacteriota bacterium]